MLILHRVAGSSEAGTGLKTLTALSAEDFSQRLVARETFLMQSCKLAINLFSLSVEIVI